MHDQGHNPHHAAVNRRRTCYLIRRNTHVSEADRDEIKWRTSTASNGSGCVEVAFTEPAILVRDSTKRSGAVLSVPRSAWRAFIAAARDGQHDI